MTNDIELTEITGPDEDGYVWATVVADREQSTINLGKKDQAVETMCQWLGSIDACEAEMRK